MSLQPLPLSPDLAARSELLPRAKGFVFPLLFPAQDAQPQNNRGRKGRCPGPRVPAGSQVRVELRDPLWKVLGSSFPFPGDVAGLGHGKGDLDSLRVCLAGLSCPRSLSWGWWLRGLLCWAVRGVLQGGLILSTASFWLFELSPLVLGSTTAGGTQRSALGVGDGARVDLNPGEGIVPAGKAAPCPIPALQSCCCHLGSRGTLCSWAWSRPWAAAKPWQGKVPGHRGKGGTPAGPN